MTTQPFEMPHSLGMPTVLAICAQLHELPGAKIYELDFSKTQHFEPFGMLLVGAAIRRLRERTNPDGSPVSVVLTGKSSRQGHDYARRLGFWWSIGDETDLPTVKRSASLTTIPITRLSLVELYKLSAGLDPVRSEVVSIAAANLATTLCGTATQSALWLALEYCFREMFRNVVEHSRADAIWYTAATRPKKDDVQIAIADCGDGVREALAENPSEQHKSDLLALRAALRPGVSGKAHKARSKERTQRLREDFPDQDPTVYDNSGFGLTLTSSLGRDAGQFAIVSGVTCLAYISQHETVSETWHAGTAVRLVLHPSKLEGALDRATLQADRDSGRTPRSGSLITASMVSRLGLRKNS